LSPTDNTSIKVRATKTTATPSIKIAIKKILGDPADTSTDNKLDAVETKHREKQYTQLGSEQPAKHTLTHLYINAERAE